MPDQEATPQLDRLFDRWIDTYPEVARDGFHRDGIVHEPSYRAEDHRVLFVLLEPNSRGGAYDKYHGWDLRRVFGEEALSKSINTNLARWTRALLDGNDAFESFDGRASQNQIRRTAVMNLKKIAGSGTADYAAAAIHAWQDRDFIREQVEIMRPSIAVACGREVNRVFRWIMKDDLFTTFDDQVGWKHAGFVVVPGNHPSLRPTNAPAAFDRIVEMAKRARLAAFGEQ